MPPHSLDGGLSSAGNAWQSETMNGLFELLTQWLPLAVPPEPVELVGGWSAPVRRGYRSASQLDSGSGPYVEFSIDDVDAARMERLGELFEARAASRGWRRSTVSWFGRSQRGQPEAGSRVA